MPIKRYKPTSPGRRFMSVSSFEEVTRGTPEKSLTEHLKKHSGRNNTGSITVRHRGGGHKKLYRIIDFKRNKLDIPGRVATIEYDPNRSARIALINYADGEKRYILAPLGLAVGDSVMAGPKAEVRPGNSLPLASMPLGTTIHNIELKLGRGGQLVRSAGGAAQLLAKEGGFATLAHAQRRGAPRRPALLGDRRPGGQRRPRERDRGQGGQVALARLAAVRPRHDHEPLRPPARRW